MRARPRSSFRVCVFASVMSAACPGTPGELEPHEEVFQYDGGISEFVEFLAHDERITDTWRFSGSGSFTETVPVLGEDGRSQLTDVEARLRSGRCAALGHWL